MKYLELIVRNLMRRTRRTILTIVMIAIATLVFAMLMAVPASMDHIIDMAARGQRLFVTNRSGPYGVPAQDCEEIKQMAHVERMRRELGFLRALSHRQRLGRNRGIGQGNLRHDHRFR